MLHLCKILLLGDSLITGIMGIPNSYNAGIIGDTSTNVAHRAVNVIGESCPQAKAVVLHVGVNNIDLSINEHQKYYTDIFNKICNLSKKRLVVLESPITWNYSKIQQLNRLLKELTSHSECASFLEVPKNLSEKLGGDKIHLTSQGYKLWGNHIQEFLKKEGLNP